MHHTSTFRSSSSITYSRELTSDTDDGSSHSEAYSGDRSAVVLTEDATIAISIASSILVLLVGFCLYYIIRKLNERRGVYFSRQLAYSQSSWVPVILTINVDEVLAIELSETGVADCTDVTNGKEKKYIVDPRLLRYSQPSLPSGSLSPNRRVKIHPRGADALMLSPSSSESKATVKEIKESDVFDKTYSIRRKIEGLPFLFDTTEGDPRVLSTGDNGQGSTADNGQGRENSYGGSEADGPIHSITSSTMSSRASFDMDSEVTSTSAGSTLSSSPSSSSVSESPRNLTMVTFSHEALSESPTNTDMVGVITNSSRRARRLQQEDTSKSETTIVPSVYESKQARASGVLKTVLQEVRYVPVVQISENQDANTNASSEKKKWRRGSVISV
jgi:hypothetical protein